MAESLKKKTLRGVFWSGVENFTPKIAAFFVTLVVARILSPKDYGLIGMMTIFTAIATSIVNSGFSNALIRKLDRTETDCCTVFYFNIVVSLLMYGILYLIAPWAADFYEEPLLCDVMRVQCLGVVINGFAVVQRALYTATVNFKTQAKATFAASTISGIIAIILALRGFGVWTLVIQSLANATFNVVFLWWASSWRPKLLYSWKSFRELFSFGSKLLISGLIYTIYSNLYSLVIGKVFSAASLGHFSRANHFSTLFSHNTTSLLQRVTYPVLCKMQDDNQQLRNNYRKMLRVSAYTTFPFMCGLAGVSFPLIEVLIGAKWHFASVLLIPICFSGMWYPIHAINLNLLQVKGRPNLFLRLEIIKKIIGVILLIISIPYGLIFMCWFRITGSILALILNTYYTGKLLDLGFNKQMKDLMPSFLLSMTVFAVTFSICEMINNNWIALALAIPAGMVVYVGGSFLFKFEELAFLKSLRK
jgi:O-antigen/teichoic acid export membrane protein